ncbi:MAG: hypothetical protein ABJP82_22235, partial [Hyphomicrobiales bacterium]
EILNELRSEHSDESGSQHSGSAIAYDRRPEPDSPIEPSDDSANECAFADHAGSCQELDSPPDPDAPELAKAADDLQPQAKAFKGNRIDELGAGDVEAAPDLSDPNLLIRLARMLRKAMDHLNFSIVFPRLAPD